jgi:hypothetical protein
MDGKFMDKDFLRLALILALREPDLTVRISEDEVIRANLSEDDYEIAFSHDPSGPFVLQACKKPTPVPEEGA